MYYQQLDKGEVMYLQYNERAKVFGNFLAKTNQKGFVRAIEAESREDASSVIQQGQCMGWLFLLINVNIIKVFKSYLFFVHLIFQ